MNYYNDYISDLILEKNASLELAEITSSELVKLAEENRTSPEEILYEIGLEKAASYANDLLVYLDELHANGLTLDENGQEVRLPMESEKTASGAFPEEIVERAKAVLYGE